MDSKLILAAIEQRLGFVPPFFDPAAEHPEVLANLWHQTESAYLDNALPELFKEKLAALLGRYCEVPYCLVCHTCSLRPLGMSGPAIVDLLTQRHPSDAQISAILTRWDTKPTVIDMTALDAETESDVFGLASAIYFAGPLAPAARERLRRRTTSADYRNLVVFTTYNKMCHEWIAAHPEVSFEVDQRYVRNYSPLADEAAGFADLFADPHDDGSATRARRMEAVVADRTAEVGESLAISERRYVDVLGAFKARIDAALSQGAEKEELAKELGRTADFTQELLAIVSHDLRNPLNNVLMGAQLVLQLEPGNAKIHKPLRRILASARRAERLIYDLLDFSQARASGTIPIHLRPVDLRTVVRAATEELEVEHPGRSFVVDHEGDGHGEWDADRLAQVLSNLLANAISHGNERTPVVLSTRGDGESVTIAVHNENRDGPVPPALLPVLFEPFKRGIARAASATRSVGLGLYIVQELARGHRGHVAVQSDATGTTFSVRLPRNSTSPAIVA